MKIREPKLVGLEKELKRTKYSKKYFKRYLKKLPDTYKGEDGRYCLNKLFQQNHTHGSIVGYV